MPVIQQMGSTPFIKLALQWALYLYNVHNIWAAWCKGVLERNINNKMGGTSKSVSVNY